jgi:hypothetical protein
MENDLKKNIIEALKYSGYPLEQRIGYILEKHGWSVFHSINYLDPVTEKERELDILAYKLINERRIELRISCKRSISKPWVLFTEDSTKYFQHGSFLKMTPVSCDLNKYQQIPQILKKLPFFSHTRRAINFTVFTGKDLNSESRSLMKDGLLSSLNSVHHRIFPDWLLFDERGTIYFFLTIFDGLLFEAWYNPTEDKDEIKQINYGQFDKKLELFSKRKTIHNSNGKSLPLDFVLYWFSEWFRIEIITLQHFSEHLQTLETVFNSIPEEYLQLFGKTWSNENFPKTVKPMPKFKT